MANDSGKKHPTRGASFTIELPHQPLRLPASLFLDKKPIWKGWRILLVIKTIPFWKPSGPFCAAAIIA